MTELETIDRLADLVGGIGGEIDDSWSDHAIADSLGEIDGLDATDVPADAAEISAAAAIISALAQGVEPHGVPAAIERLAGDIDTLSATLAVIATKATESETAAATLRQTVIAEFTNLATATRGAIEILSSDIGREYGQFEELHLLTTQTAVEDLIVIVRDRHMTSLSQEIDKTVAGFSEEATATVMTVTDIRGELVLQLSTVQERAMTQLNAGLSTLANNAQQAIEQRALNLLQAELSNAAESIVVGQTLQIGLSTGPWLQAIALAKAAMQMLP